VIAAGSFHLLCSYLCGSRRKLEQNLHLTLCPISWDHLSVSVASIPNNLGIIIKADQLNAFEGMLR
jgi:hypothetical protein